MFATPAYAFLDTEFTDLLAPELLSIGLVAMDGRECYAELDLTTEPGKSRASASGNFARGGVLDMWGLVPDAPGTELEMGHRVAEFLLGVAARSGTRIQVAFDYSTDYELMEYLIRDSDSGMWGIVREVVSPVNISAITGSRDGQRAAEACYQELRSRGLNRHHALADALALRAAFRTRDVTAGARG